MTEHAYAKPPGVPWRMGADRTSPAGPGVSSRPFRIVPGIPGDWADIAADEIILVCPWLGGLDPCTGLWLAALPIHDCNAFIDSDWTLEAPTQLRERCYVGVFALDRLRSGQQIFGPLRDKGVARLINLPSIGFFDGATAQTFGRLAFTLDSEIGFLAQARGLGFDTALCARSDVALAPERAAQFDFILRHQGPDRPLRIEDA
ncbi:hypothetical protein [Bosea sp. BK604]|uniref:hypothetical protein n=1 Tax=Bosea sp. BK604 TaxID=2512180 RepID=UPI0010CFE708|nr:hypothetical protein [Bosea sp. BK604]TCR66620.1 phosphoenolpyruvate hydrolase-like protein [Bosea sp. BK604]